MFRLLPSTASPSQGQGCPTRCRALRPQTAIWRNESGRSDDGLHCALQRAPHKRSTESNGRAGRAGRAGGLAILVPRPMLVQSVGSEPGGPWLSHPDPLSRPHASPLQDAVTDISHPLAAREGTLSTAVLAISGHVLVVPGQAGWAAAPVHSVLKSHGATSGQPPSRSGNWNEIQSRLHSRNLSFRCSWQK